MKIGAFFKKQIILQPIQLENFLNMLKMLMKKKIAFLNSLLRGDDAYGVTAFLYYGNTLTQEANRHILRNLINLGE